MEERLKSYKKIKISDNLYHRKYKLSDIFHYAQYKLSDIFILLNKNIR